MKLLLLLSLVYASDAYRILVVFPTLGKSHSILGQGFVDTLSQAGHEITYITPFPYEKLPANVQQINISSVMDNIPEQESSEQALPKPNFFQRNITSQSSPV
ncbi:hypothetical protein EVAR_12115_1 [Eumeta japonica]|uniref:Ecdysteroid UDP-glucosyltransferase n=1 Tax=Eumeta variegata TaxID=151549 RepID=A0A4C1U6C5_EUMVA|nr:hypothetical protein EVAR_12115_1 [Eumeta japonica]